MKKKMSQIILYIILFSSFTNLYAQQPFVDGAVVKGKNATYFCKVDRILMEVRNANNVYKTPRMFFDNGTVVPHEHTIGGRVLHSNEDIFSALQKIFTTSEWNSLKSSGSHFVMSVVADKQGNTKEILYFNIRTKDSVLTKLDADRFYLLEEALKKVMKIKVGVGDRSIKNVIYAQLVDFKDFK